MTRAVRLMAPGARPQLVDVELSDPAAGEVLVAVDHAGVNPIDTYAVAGTVGDLSGLPRTLGVEGTGLVGDTRVVVSGAGLGLTRDGTWAGAVVAPRDAVVELPPGVDPAQAGALGTAGVTAHEVVHRLARIGPGDRVLVLGAAGGVGTVAVQLAKLAGATVLGQVGSPAKRDLVADLGADAVLVADAASLAGRLAAVGAVGAAGPTVVLDPLGGGFLAAVVDGAEPDTRIVSYGASAGGEATIPVRAFYRKGLRLLGYAGVSTTAERRAAALRSLAAELAAGRLRIVVADVVALDRVDEAIARLRDRSVQGKIVLDTRA